MPVTREQCKRIALRHVQACTTKKKVKLYDICQPAMHTCTDDSNPLIQLNWSSLGSTLYCSMYGRMLYLKLIMDQEPSTLKVFLQSKLSWLRNLQKKIPRQKLHPSQAYIRFRKVALVIKPAFLCSMYV